jgi:hypothetical protein
MGELLFCPKRMYHQLEDRDHFFSYPSAVPGSSKIEIMKIGGKEKNIPKL